jgi:cob(I)alamin adenosyltransferase
MFSSRLVQLCLSPLMIRRSSLILPQSSAANYCSKKVPEAENQPQEKKKIKLKTKDRSTSSLPRIYTRTGDRGTSSLFTGERRTKTDEIFEALGTIDELSSHIGLAMASANIEHPYVEQLQRIQCILQDVGSAVATPSSSARKIHQEKTMFNNRHTAEMEEWIDDYTQRLPPLENFILPGGSLTASSLHVARAVCRRAERRVLPLTEKDEVDWEALKYLNRLSDFLFTVARYAAKLDKTEETVYIRPDTRSKPYKPVTSDVWKKPKD